MKILLTTLNSQYVHSNLAIRYMYTVIANEDCEAEIREFSINNDLNYIYNEIVRADYDLVCFSFYLWNILSYLSSAAVQRVTQLPYMPDALT